VGSCDYVKTSRYFHDIYHNILKAKFIIHKHHPPNNLWEVQSTNPNAKWGFARGLSERDAEKAAPGAGLGG